MADLRSAGRMAGLLHQKLVLVSGKGGVGKSTVASALALRAARAGRRTLVCEVNAKERVSRLLGYPEVGPELRELEPDLWAVNVRPDEALREYALMIVRYKAVYKAVFENRLVRYFLRFLPSMAELVMLGKILFHTKEELEDGRPRFDTVIVDAPATGHAITFFSVPKVLLETVPPGPLAEEARWMRDLLVDPSRTRAVLVCLPEEMPVNETLELEAALRTQVGITTHAVVMNGCIPERFEAADLRRLEDRPQLYGLARIHRERAELCTSSCERLTSVLSQPVYSIPRLFTPTFGRAAIEHVSGKLAPLWEAP